MTDHKELVDKAFNNLWMHRTIRHKDQDYQIACLLRFEDWRPLKADWWRGKEVCIVGADLQGNFFLRHCDGSIRYWNHNSQMETVVASGLVDFLRLIE